MTHSGWGVLTERGADRLSNCDDSNVNLNAFIQIVCALFVIINNEIELF